MPRSKLKTPQRDKNGRFISSKRGRSASKSNSSVASQDHKRRVTLDTNVIISSIAFNSEISTKAVTKSKTADRMMYTSVIHEEVVKFADAERLPIPKEQYIAKVKKQLPEPIEVDTPPLDELKKKYTIPDDNDLKILHSAEVTKSELIVTKDTHFYAKGMKGPADTKIITPKQYLNELDPRFSTRKRRK